MNSYEQGKADREQELAFMHPADRQRIFDAYIAAEGKRGAAPVRMDINVCLADEQ